MTWISKSRAAGLLKTTLRTVELRMAANQYRKKLATHPVANNKRPALVCLEDLGSEAVRRYHELHAAAVPSPGNGAAPPAAPAAPAGGPDPSSLDSAAEPPARAVEEATRRRGLVEAAMALKAASPARATAALAAFARAQGVAPSTLRAWLAAYQSRGFAGLIPQWGRPPSVEPAIEDYIKQTYLQPTQPLITIVHERTADFCASIGRPAPSYRTVVRVCQAIDPAARTYHRLGKKAWAQTYEPILRRDYTDLAVGEMYCGDHRELDLFVQVGGRILRPWLTAWMDLRSRLIVGWHLDVSPSQRTIALAFRHAVLACGRPGFVYMDNGKDYKSHLLNGRERTHGRIQFDAETQGVFGMLNVAVIHALPYAARSKPIERWFRNVSERFDREQPGWCGRDNKQRPEKLAREIKAAKLRTFDEIRDGLVAFIAAYNEREHSALGATPASLWAQAAKEIPDPRTLSLLLMKSKAVRIWNDGIHLFSSRYWASELAGYVGQTVEARYDPADISRLYLFHERTLLCEATIPIAGSMKVGEAQILQKAKERKAARERVARYHDDIRLMYSPDEALAAALAARPPAPERPAPPPAITGGRTVPLITAHDRDAREIAALPAPPPQDETAPAAAVNDPWAGFIEEQLVDYEAAQRGRAADEARERRLIDEQWQIHTGGDHP